jgi:uncharacterized protein YdeI (YjbR/CyaY-like superfamily)
VAGADDSPATPFASDAEWERWLQENPFTPRRRRSNWSRINVEKVERLTTEGRMRPAGVAEVERAKADGRWAAASRLGGPAPGETTIPEPWLPES